MIKLKKLIAIAVFAAMLSNGATLPSKAMPSSGTTAQGDGREKNAKASEGQNVRTTEEEPNEENLVDMTATTECEASESMELTDEHSRCEENEHSGSEANSEPDSDTEMADTEENPGMLGNKKERKLDEGCVEKATTASEHKDTESSEESACPVDAKENPGMSGRKRKRESDEGCVEKMTTASKCEDTESSEESVCPVDAKEDEHSGSEADPDTEMTVTEGNPGMPASKRARKSDEGCEEKMTTVPAHKDAEITKDPVCTATTTVGDEENPDMSASKKARKSDEAEVGAVAAASRQNEKAANDMYEQGLQFENDKDFSTAIKLYKQASELGSTAAACKLAKCYECGKGFEIDEYGYVKRIKSGDYGWVEGATKVAKLYEKAVGDPNNTKAMCKLAFYYKYGEGGVSKDLNKTIEFYQRAVAFGDTEAMCGLACCYIIGEGFPQNLEIAKGLLQQARALGDPCASNFIDVIEGREPPSKMYRKIEINPFEKPISPEEAVSKISYFDLPEKRAKIAADLGCVEGYKNLRDFYCHTGSPLLSKMWNARYLVEKDKWTKFQNDRSLHLGVERLFLEREVENGNSYAMYELGRLYEESNKYMYVYEADELYKQAAKMGNLASMVKVGVYYRDGKCGYRNTKDAEEWLKFSAEIGSVEGMYEYGVFLEEVEFDAMAAITWYNRVAEMDANRRAEVMRRIGKCYKFAEAPNLKQAIEYLQRAVDLGDTEAMRQLGICYENGEGVGQNLNTAADFYRRAVELRNTKAIVNLASCYENGHGVLQDLNQSVKLLEQAVDLGDSDAMVKLASLYEDKEDLSKKVEATYLLGQAAGNEHVEAMYKLGLMFMEGKGGVNKNLDLGIGWFEQAAANEQVGKHWEERAIKSEQVISTMHKLGLMFKNGEGVIPYPRAEARWFQRAADRGNAASMAELGACYRDGKGVFKNPSLAFNWFLKAAEKGDTASMLKVGMYYRDGEGVFKNPSSAFKWFLKAAEKGDTASMIEVGVYYRDGKWVDKDAVEARKWLRFAAERNDVRGMYEFGVCLEEVMYDDTWAMEWYQKAADNGYVEAMGRLGACYKRDRMFNSKDLTEAVRWLQQAADLGDAEAMRQLGICYENGEEVAKDLSRALGLYQRAIARNNAKAMLKLASWYEQCEAGLPQDLSKAVELLQQAVDLGDSDAMFKLASWYEQGKAGLPQDLREMLRLLERASENGHVEANYKLGLMYMDGRRLPKDLRRGLMLLQKAADRGSVDAIRDLAAYYENKTEDYAKFSNLFDTKMYLEKGDEFYQLAYKCEHDDEDWREAIHWYSKAEYQYSRAELFYERAFGTRLEILKKTTCAHNGYVRCIKILADKGVEKFDFFEKEV